MGSGPRIPASSRGLAYPIKSGNPPAPAPTARSDSTGLFVRGRDSTESAPPPPRSAAAAEPEGGGGCG